MTTALNTNTALYRRAIALLALNPRNKDFPTTEALALVQNLFFVTCKKLMRDINRYIEKADPIESGDKKVDTDSPEFREWWKRNMERQ